MKEQFLEIIKRYEEQFGSARALEVQGRFKDLKEKVVEENEGLLEWLPERKRDVTLETLLQKTYQKLIDEMEEKMQF